MLYNLNNNSKYTIAMKKRINESRLSNIVRRNIRMVMNESHGEPEQYPCVLIDNILEDYQAEEIAEEDGLESADKAAMRYFSETMYASEEREAMMPKYSNYIDSIDEEHDLYRDYGAGYYFVVVKRMAEGKKRPTANRLNESIRRTVRRFVNEAVNEMATSSDRAIEGFRQLVDRLNGIVESQKSQYGDAWLIEKDGSHYQLTQPVRLMNNGVLVVSTQYSFGSRPEVEKIRVFTKRGGKTVLYKNDCGTGFCDDARYAKKLLTKMIADAERSGKHLEGYDPNWEDEGKGGEKKIRGFERSIGIRR